MKIAVLGAGMVGRTIAADLSKDYDVTSIDASLYNLQLVKEKCKANTQQAHLQEYDTYAKILAPFDICVCALPGHMGYNALKACIKAGKNVVDISFFKEDAFELESLAKENKVTAIVDCGLAPGMANFIVGYHNEKMKIENFVCMVGGLPKNRVKPFEYKAPFSPIDVIEEYTRPSRYKENGEIVVKPALTDITLHEFDKVGTLQSFNTDGLRSLLQSMAHIPNMKEKTMRYPGHAEFIQDLQAAGFFSPKTMNIQNAFFSPLDITSKILFEQWKLDPKEEEFTVMEVKLTGKEDGKQKEIIYSLYSEYDTATSTSSMSRTTGFTCTAAVNMIAKKMFVEKGIFPPEFVGRKEACFTYLMEYLAERNVVYHKSEKWIS